MSESNLTPIDWQKSKQETLDKLAELPSYNAAEIVQDYQRLLNALQEPDIKDMPYKLKAFTLHQRFERFALSYSFLFNLAVKREKPVTADNVRQILEIAEQERNKEITNEEARVAVMTIARK